MRQQRIRQWFVIRGVIGVCALGVPVGLAIGQTTTPPTAPASPSTPTSDDADSPVGRARREILRIIRTRDSAIENKDLEGSLRSYASDYHYQEEKQPRKTKDDLRKGEAQTLALAQTIIARTTIDDVQLSDNDKTATLTEHSQLVLVTAPAKKEKSHTIKLNAVARAVWARTGDGTTWLKKSQTTTSMTGSIDGVPQNTSTPPAASPPSSN